MSQMMKNDKSAVDTFNAIVAILIIIVVILAGLLYINWTAPRHSSPDEPVVEDNDEVGFVYTGWIEGAFVFETLYEEVATDNITYPKSLFFEWPEEGKFDPIVFEIGTGIPGTGFEGMANNGKILEDALLGMIEGETKTVWVTPEDGFGERNQSKITTLELVEEMYQMESMTSDEYFDRYESPVVLNATLEDPIWGWDVRVTEIDNSPETPIITVWNDPDPGMIITPYRGFESKVVSVDSGANEGKGEIVVEHLLTPDDVNKVAGDDPTDGKFTVVGVDSNAKTFTADFNLEKAGVNLKYEIEVVSIEKR